MKRNTKLVAGSLAAIAIAASATWLLRSPPPKNNIVSDAARSGDYASVTDAIKAGKIGGEELRTAIREEFQHQTLARLSDYYGTDDAKKRQAVLDKAIDDLEKFRAESKTVNDGANLAPSGDARLAIASWAMSQPADTRARLAEFRVAMEKRREERGLPGLFSGPLPLGKS